MTQFIGVYENAFSKEYCEKVIKYFEDMKSNGFTLNRQAQGESKLLKDDEAAFGHHEEHINLKYAGGIHRQFNETFWKIYNEQYSSKFAILKESGNHNNYAFKVQKTIVGGGYHVWHYESMEKSICDRLLTWMVYLNDVEEGGETEFLYQHLRVRPKAGTLVIWPAAFTHTHRGNPPLSNDKYIITGWTEF